MQFVALLLLIGLHTARDAQSKARVVTLIAKDFNFVAPDTITAGVKTFLYRNEGAENHEALLRRIPDGHQVKEVLAAVGSDKLPEWLEPIGGPNNVAPARETRVVQTLVPGTYVWVCYLGTRRGPAHYKLGMIRPMVVVSSTHRDPEPRAAAVLTMRDFSYELSRPLRRSRQWLLVRNEGHQYHEVVMFKLLPGKTAADVEEWMRHGGPRADVPIGGVGALPPAAHAYVQFPGEPGTYSFRCRVFDSGKHQSHEELGMQLFLTVQ